MIAVILAAGMAKRLRPLTDNKPKCLLEINKRCLLERTIEALLKYDVTEFVVVTGYFNKMIEEFVMSHYQSLKITFIHNEVYESTNNIYSLWLTREAVDGKDFLLLDSDLLFDPDIIGMTLEGNVPTLALNRHELGEEEMKVVADEDGKITEISKTCNPKDAIGESVGIERITPNYSTALFKELDIMMSKEHLENVFYEQAFMRLIPKSHSFTIADISSLFATELDTVEDFNNAEKLIPRHLL